MKIGFRKAHGARNDFLLSWADEVPAEESRLRELAVAICDRHTGVGADGWLLVGRASGPAHASIRLFNSDGSDSEISGNGTRCAAACLIDAGLAGEDVRIATGAGLKHLRLLERRERSFTFEMNMGRAVAPDGGVSFPLALTGGVCEVTILNVGNPQCAVFVEDYSLDWRRLGAEIERHPHFPNRTNVSFVRVADEHTVEARFWERGAGETMSSGTGSTGAAAAARLRHLVNNPVRVVTPAGPLDLRWQGEDIYLRGPAEIVAEGQFYC